MPEYGSYQDIVDHSYLKGCVELPASYDPVPTRWRNQAEVVEIREAIEDLIGTTYQTLQAARALLNETQNPAKLRKILVAMKDDTKLCAWLKGKGLRAFAFKAMILTKYHEKPKETEGWWSSDMERHVNR